MPPLSPGYRTRHKTTTTGPQASEATEPQCPRWNRAPPSQQAWTKTVFQVRIQAQGFSPATDGKTDQKHHGPQPKSNNGAAQELKQPTWTCPPCPGTAQRFSHQSPGDGPPFSNRNSASHAEARQHQYQVTDRRGHPWEPQGARQTQGQAAAHRSTRKLLGRLPAHRAVSHSC